MIRCRSILFCMTALFSAYWFSEETASAQQNSLFGSRGALQSSTGFGTGSTGLSNGQSGGGGLNPTAQAAGLSNSAGLGGSMGASGGLGATGGAGAAAGVGNQGGFIGRNDSAGRFVGQTQAGNQQVGAGRQGGMNQFNRGGAQMGGNNRNRNGNTNRNGNNQNQMMGGAGSSMQQRIIRPQQKVAFEYPLPTAQKTESTLSTRFQKLAAKTPDQSWLQGVTVDAEDGGRVVLRGTVESAEQRRLAAIMAGFEPGVRSVQNELTVRETATDAE